MLNETFSVIFKHRGRSFSRILHFLEFYKGIKHWFLPLTFTHTSLQPLHCDEVMHLCPSVNFLHSLKVERKCKNSGLIKIKSGLNTMCSQHQSNNLFQHILRQFCTGPCCEDNLLAYKYWKVRANVWFMLIFKSFMSYYGIPAQGPVAEHISPLLHLMKRQSLGLGVIALTPKIVTNKIKFMIDSLINNSHFILIKM